MTKLTMKAAQKPQTSKSGSKSNLRMNKHELRADLIFVVISSFLSTLIVFLFDIHQSFFPGASWLPPSKYLFSDPLPYYILVPFGTLLGFFIFKILFFAYIEEEKALGRSKKQSTRKR